VDSTYLASATSVDVLGHPSLSTAPLGTCYLFSFWDLAQFFDTILIENVFIQLCEASANSIVIRILLLMNSGLEAMVRTGSGLSERFAIET